MTLRRALWASPLAVSVAVLAHLVAFGFLHAPGAGNAPALLWTLAATLVLGLCGTFAGEATANPRASIATSRPSRYAPLLLAAAGTVAFGLIELSEGHLALFAFVQAAFAALPLAYLVTFTARCASRVARDAGHRYAAYAHRKRGTSSGRPAVTWLDRCSSRVFTSILGGGASRGRAPPVFI